MAKCFEVHFDFIASPVKPRWVHHSCQLTLLTFSFVFVVFRVSIWQWSLLVCAGRHASLTCRLLYSSDTVVVQVQQWGVVGTQQVVDQVILNGVVLTDTKEVDIIIRTISTDTHLLALTGANQTVTPGKNNSIFFMLWVYFRVVSQLVSTSSHFLANHIVLRERECILEGSRVQWTDRVFCDGTIFLSLDRTDNWRPHVPQALGFKVLLEQTEQQATNSIRLEEGCARLMRELKLSEEHSGIHMYIDI